MHVQLNSSQSMYSYHLQRPDQCVREVRAATASPGDFRGNAVARHGAERVSEAMMLQLGGGVLQSGLESYGYDTKTQAAAATVYGMTTQLGRVLPHSRGQESEADYMGLLFMARAGYDPEAAIGFWQRFAAQNQSSGGAQTAWFLRTHPLDQKRIEQMRQWQAEAREQMPVPRL